ncbi:sensor histidine kinase [Ancylobacter terrae]|uniref:sensor histidine kinase n=1 Tax=Ancylobacter sp. sgz301288 TaxID=3342077 RepID=UPI00385975FB
MLAEILIYVPAISAFRLNWLSDRLAAARTAALVLDAAPEGTIPPKLTQELLDSVGAITVALKQDNTRRLLASSEMPPEVDHHADVRDVGPLTAATEAFQTLMASDGRIIRVVGSAPRGGDFIEIVLSETPLRKAMLRFSRNILLVSLLISALTAGLVYLGLAWMFVRPMRRLTQRMIAFREAPEGQVPALDPCASRHDEIGQAEREFVAMQRRVAETLQQKNHLAALGLAVSKINHDLRNLLASAHLVSDRLAMIRDPAVQRFAPKLMAALDRAIAYCEHTLAYGRAQEPPPERRMIELAPLVAEVRDTVGLDDGERPVGWVESIDRGLTVDADADQLFRVLLNLARNAIQALRARAPTDAACDQVRITGRREGAIVIIEVSDTGPGVPERARQHLFEPFQGSTRRGGTGLGLAIAAELMRAHGGDIKLVPGTIGATFQLTIPDRPVDLEAHRARLSHG